MFGKATGQPEVSVLRTPSTMFLSRVSLRWKLTDSARLADPWGPGTHLHHPMLELQASALSPIFLHGCWGWDSGVHAHIVHFTD